MIRDIFSQQATIATINEERTERERERERERDIRSSLVAAVHNKHIKGEKKALCTL